MLDQFRGCLLGLAVGDALGAPLEFMGAEDIAAKHGRVTEMLGGGWLKNFGPASVMCQQSSRRTPNLPGM